MKDRPIQLGFLYRTLRRTWTEYLLYRSEAFSLPTQVVVDEPQIVTPKQARAYTTDLVIYEGNAVTSADPGLFREIYKLPSISLVEVWGNHGDDIYTQRGWRFVPEKTLELRNRWYRGTLRPPEPMLMQIWDYDDGY